MRLTPLLLGLSLTVARGVAATHTVLPDTSIQAKIDLAQPGDIIAILGGVHDQDVSVAKAVRLVGVDEAS